MLMHERLYTRLRDASVRGPPARREGGAAKQSTTEALLERVLGDQGKEVRVLVEERLQVRGGIH